MLDGLRWIRVHKDPTLAFRYSCINANACKECMMEIDVRPRTPALRGGSSQRAMTVEPLANKMLDATVIKIAPPQERFYLSSANARVPVDQLHLAPFIRP